MADLVLPVEVHGSGFPFVADFGQAGGDEAFAGLLVGAAGGDAGAALAFWVASFQAVGGAAFFALGGWQGQDGEAVRPVGFEPVGEVGSGVFVFCGEGFEAALGFRQIGSLPEGTEVGGDLLAPVAVGDEGQGVLLEMQLATLPGAARTAGGGRPGVRPGRH